MDVTRVLTGVGKARWLAELALAIDEAEQAAERIGILGIATAEAQVLRERLQAVKREVEQLRLGGWRTAGEEIGSKRIMLGGG